MQQTEETLKVEWMLPDGRAGGRCARGTFKVRGALPGDRIVATSAKERARLLEVLTFTSISEGPRVDHPCPVIERCGGCDLGTLPPDIRRRALTTLVQRALNREAPPEWIQPSSSVRSRIKLSFTEKGVGFHTARSHDLVPISSCDAAHPLLSREISHLLDHGPIRGATSIELRTDGTKVVGVLDGGKPTPQDLPHLEHLAVKGRTLRGDATLNLSVAGLQLRASPLSFFQVNAPGNELLVQRVLNNVRRVQPERLLDLYSGIGNLTLPIAALGIPTVAVELEGQATRDLAHNARTLGLSVEIHKAKVERFDTTTIPFDMVVLDPPRAGSPGVLDRVLFQRPRAIQVISCHVPSAARDLRPVLKAGYRITDFAVVDLFAPTHHIETMVLLERP